MQAFDTIIVGGGSAGCVLASRLSEEANRSVLLIEAGADTPPGQVPPEIQDSYPMALFHGDRYVWPGLRATLCRTRDGSARVRDYEQGRVMGGGSSVNVQAANRGLPRDYDEWAAQGAAGWSWQDVLPYFRKLERDLDCDGPLHGRDGPLPIRRIPPQAFPPFGSAVADSFAASGLSMRLDQNGDFDDGLFPPAFSNESDRRASAAQAYLGPTVRARPNLAIWPDSRVIGLDIAGRQVAAVRVRRAAGDATVSARRIVLSAGALQTPAMLLRAGIGPGRHLAELGIPVVADLPGVGNHLQDHPALTLCQYLPRRLRLPMAQRRASFVAMRYSSDLPGGQASDMYVTASARAGWHGLGARLGLYFLWCNRPCSTGSVRLRTPAADDYPAIDLNLLSDPRDAARLADGVRRLARLIVVPGLNPSPDALFPAGFTPRIKRLSAVTPLNAAINAALGWLLDVPAPIRHRLLRGVMANGAPLAGIVDDDALLDDFVRRNVFGVWHASGTCRLGGDADPQAVTDTAGKVRGMENLYVCDASLMPRLPTANTNIPVLMMAEKIGDGLRRC